MVWRGSYFNLRFFSKLRTIINDPVHAGPTAADDFALFLNQLAAAHRADVGIILLLLALLVSLGIIFLRFFGHAILFLIRI